MGTCLSKKKGSSSSSPVAGTNFVSLAPVEGQEDSNTLKSKVEDEMKINQKKEKETEQEKQAQHVQDVEGQLKKEIFIIKHRKSHDGRDKDSKFPPAQQNAALAADGVASSVTNEAPELMGNKISPPSGAIGVVGVRTSSCSKEEVDAILIQCGRLSRSSSGKVATSSAGRKYSGSKRSFDFDHCDNDVISADDDQKKVNAIGTEDDEIAAEKRRQHRQRHRESPRSSSKGRRRTPSREREQQQRSSSRERRVSRSPGRRASESTTPANTVSANASNNTSSRPGKMVSVPATVSSLVTDKSNNGGGGEPATIAGIKRISVKRNVGDTGVMGSRSAASPRSQSPSRTNGKVSNDNQLQQPSLSRNSSRKAEHSPYRRNPLSEIDPNILAYPQPSNNNSSKVQNRAKKELEEANQKPNVDIVQGTHHRTRSRGSMEKVVSVDGKSKEQQQADAKGQSSMTDNIVVKTVVASGVDNLKPQTLTRTRSSRRSRDLDLDPEALLNSTPSYTKLLLEDIHNFHQKNTPSVSLPACVTKACSILEAVADLNSTTSSNFSSAVSEDKKSPLTYQTIRNDFNLSLGVNHFDKKMPEAIDPFVESEIVVSDDVMEPSFHKYITVRRGGALGGADMEDQESSGSNSFVASGQQNWGFHSSAWEPNSADSTDCLTSRLNNREEDQKSPNGFDGNLLSEAGPDSYEARRKLNSKRRENDHRHSSGIGRGRLGASNGSKGGHMIPVVAATAST